MKPELLQKARQERWRHNSNPLLTLDDAERWLGENPLCLFLPRRAHLPVPAPSFAEAVEGKADATPPPAVVAKAKGLLARLVASGAVIPLNMLGAVGETPDFLATPEALSFVYALQPERNPKRPPATSGAGKVSPLAFDVWQALERQGALTTAELREALGREVTEAAVLRSLSELWQSMRVVPVPGENGVAAHWELLAARHRKELNTGSTLAQGTALSVLISMYLGSAIVATSEEIELFLSPFTSRSRVRDALRGLAGTQQLGQLSMEAHSHYFLEGALPEMPEEELAAEMEGGLVHGEQANGEQALEGNQPDRSEVEGRRSPERGAGLPERGARPERQARPERSGGPRERERRPAAGKRPLFGERSRSGFGSGPRERSGFGGGRPGARGGRPAGGGRSFERRARPAVGGPEGSAGERERPRFDRERPAGARPARPFGGREGALREGSGGRERPGRPERAGGSGSASRPGGKRFGKAGGRPFGKSGERPFRKGGDRPFGREDAGREGTGREGKGRAGGFGKAPFGAAGGGRPRFEKPGKPYERPRRRDAGEPPAGARPAGERPAGEGRSQTFRERFGGPARPRPSGDRAKSGPPRSGGEFAGRPAREGGSRSSGGRPGARNSSFQRERPAFGGNRPGFVRSRPPRREGEGRPSARREGAPGGERPPFRKRPEGERTSFRKTEEAGRPAFGKRTEGGRPSFRKGPEGGRPPFRKRPEGEKPSGERPAFRKRPEGGGGAARPGKPAGRFGGSGGVRGRGSPGGDAGRPRGGAPKAGRPGTGRPGGGGFQPPRRKAPAKRRPDEEGS